MQKNDARQMLNDYNMEALISGGEKERGLIRVLTSLVYDKEDVTSWRAIEAIGLISGVIAKRNPEQIRNVSQRFLWMLREESGNGPGSAPEILGEIVRNNPDAFADIGQVLTSFHDEQMLRPGVMRAIWRITDIRPDLLSLTKELLDQKIYLRDDNPAVRVYAVMIAGILKLSVFLPEIEELKNDQRMVRIYDGGHFRETMIAEIANQVYAGLSGREN